MVWSCLDLSLLLRLKGVNEYSVVELVRRRVQTFLVSSENSGTVEFFGTRKF